MSTATFESHLMTSIHAERSCACPFSIATDYAIDYLKEAESGGPQAVVRAPLPLLPAVGCKVSMSFGLAIDVGDGGRTHDEIRLRWKSGSSLLPNFRGTIRFRIDGVCTVVAIDGSYEPPMGPFGRLFDRIAGRWLAQRTLSDLARSVGRDLERREREWRAAHHDA